ncbi:MAG: hypothetical protein Q8R91_04165 [Candidatus Omnitrophota bacterium]|nr:hypothetical protein [Candidatus Omnitrophota bacterium]
MGEEMLIMPRSAMVRRVGALARGVFFTSCATAPPYTGVGPYPQLERGRRHPKMAA